MNCSVDQCERERSFVNGLCVTHNRHMRVYGEIRCVRRIRRQIREADKYDENGHRLCVTCRRHLALGEFAKNGDGLQNACMLCNNLHKYGLDRNSYQAKLDAQGGVCALCGSPDPRQHGRFHVDHDHDHCPAGKGCKDCVRSLLCSPCNQGLGYFKDDPRLLTAAIAYLSKHGKGFAA